MKLLFATKSLDVAGGGAERVLTIVASELAARGHDVSVVTFDAPGGASFYPLDERIRRIALGIGKTDQPSGLADFARRIRALRRAVRAERPDAVVGFMHSMFVPLSFATVGLDVPRVASEHTVPEYYRGRGGEFTLFMLGCVLSTRVTVLSPAVRDMYPRFLRRRMVPVPNPVPAPSAARPIARGGATRTILAVGRLGPEKDHATLIDAFASIANRFPDWALRIVGDGTLRGELERRVAARGLAGRVALPGATARIGDEYARADLFAVPSRYESFGLATAEALAAGLPVLGFADCPGTNELLEHNCNGWLVDTAAGVDRSAAFATGLAALIGDAALRARLAGEAAASVERFSPDRVTARWETLLREVIGHCTAPNGRL